MGLSIVLATGNRGKISEIREILADTGIEVLTVDDLAAWPEPEETGDSFEENALIKAKAAWEATGHPALADDSGLEVDALGGRPGIFSARYGGDGLSDSDRCRRLLEELDGLPAERRTCRFRCSMVLYPSPFDRGKALVTEGILEGVIAESMSGESGFGYDPVFYIPEKGMTAAELGSREKNRISHRYRALVEMKALLTGAISPEW